MKLFYLCMLLFLPFLSHAQTDSTHWSYASTKDEMDGQITRSAIVYSQNVEYFQFPYNGGSRGYILIRNTDVNKPPGKGRYSLYFGLTKGQITSGSVVREKFDDSKPFYTTYLDATDNGSAIILGSLIGKNRGRVEQFAQSKKLLIEVPVFDEGSVVFHFDISGLKL